MPENDGNRLVLDPDYMVDALKLPKKAPRLLSDATTTNMPVNFNYSCDFIDIFDDGPACASVVPARISSRHCWRSPLPHALALIQRDFGCVLGVQQTKQLPHVAKVDLVWQLGV
ncbi:hypothetical protein TNCV_2930011 [Trichonephila clavipes]|nr:hypothetical protein TNCV_2930011 [Trichonephila clavipes]